MQSDDLVHLGAAELARLIRSSQADPLEVVDAHIRVIERLNPTINALVTATFDQARDETRRLRERLTVSMVDLPPLFGVPVTIKDSLPVAGVRFTAGSTFHRDNVATRDAEAVRRLKAAGAIVLGKTNCSDMSGSAETSNLIFGLTRNPWSLDHSAGGSSGGEAALIACGGSPLGLGADLGGSIRIPAAFCGVVGLKPTGGRIPTDGHIPQVGAAISHWGTVGPIARRVEDVAIALSVLSDTPVTDYRSIDLMGRRLVIPRYMSSLPVSPEVADAVENAATALRTVGMVEERVTLPMMKVALESTIILCQEWLPEFRATLGGGQAIGLWAELMAHLRGKPRVSSAVMMPVAIGCLLRPLFRFLGHGHLQTMEQLRDSILQSMGPGAVLLWPVFPTTAPRHGFAWKPNKGPNYTLVFNCLGFPAIAVPVGLSNNGLPLSVQIIGQPNEDETVLAVAATLEKAFGGWKPPGSLKDCEFPAPGLICQGRGVH